MEHPNIYRRAVVHYGEQRQLTKTLEELGALAAALARWMGSQGGDMRARAQLADHVSEEIADVEIMLEQLKIILGERYEKYLEAKKAEKIGKLARYLTMVDPLEEPNESPAD